MSKYNCPLRKEPCKYAGLKRFNYGFMSGSEDYCRHPRIKRGIYSAIGKDVSCPLPEEAPDDK